MDILAIIPARSGSKGVPNKNIRIIDNKPMLAYSIELALASKLITRVIVSSDSEQYMKIAQTYGAEAPFIRPEEFARDESLDIDVFYHALTWLRERENYNPCICVHLRPCSPVRDPLVTDNVIARLIDTPELDSVRTVSHSSETPYKMWHLSDNCILTPVISSSIEYYNMPRQSLPQTYYITGYVDAVRSDVILNQRSMTGTTIGGYIFEEYFNVDYPGDLDLVESCLKIRNQGIRRSFLFDAELIMLEKNEIVLRSIFDKICRLKKLGHTVHIRCQNFGKDEVLRKLGDITIDGIVTEFMETDYFISRKSLSFSMLEKIL